MGGNEKNGQFVHSINNESYVEVFVMQQKHVKDLMECNAVMISPDATLKEAANKMKSADCGFLPVGSAESPEGIITDRDIVIRAIAEGKDPAQEKVRDYMTSEVHMCSESDTLEGAAKAMGDHNVGRLVVEDKSGKMCGVLSFGRLIRSNNDPEETSQVVQCATGKAA